MDIMSVTVFDSDNLPGSIEELKDKVVADYKKQNKKEVKNDKRDQVKTL